MPRQEDDQKQEEPFVGIVERASLDNLLTDWRNVLHSVYVDRWLDGRITTSELVKIINGPCVASLEARPHTRQKLLLLSTEILEQKFNLITREPCDNITPSNDKTSALMEAETRRRSRSNEGTGERR